LQRYGYGDEAAAMFLDVAGQVKRFGDSIVDLSKLLLNFKV